MRNTIAFILLMFFTTVFSQEKINVILIGTVHFNNPGFDRGKVIDIDILNSSKQEDLEKITNKIVQKYNPDKVFVESSYENRENLNKQYLLYVDNKPFYNLDSIQKNFFKRYYSENEIFQLGFRLAKKSKNNAIYSIDYNLEQRYDLIESETNKNTQIDPTSFSNRIKTISDFTNNCVAKNSLSDVFVCINSKEQRELNKGAYISILNRLNNDDTFFGSDFVASWYKRNLIMYSYVQNQVSIGDKNIVIIVGAGHAAMFYDFIKNDSNFNLIDFNEVME